MGIAALPQATVRVLGASQVLTDPAAVVKELLDNSYDANATSIAVEIHSNTIDIIQVRDNGHGIAPEDRPLAARRYCTSKISHDDELKDIGGSSLGFRGEALASAAELSGSFTISTKIEGEQIASSLKISQKGEVISQEKASLPVGTTVRISDFVKSHPVRRQVVLKNADSCLKKIRHTLQAYAFARPHVRLALRVLKAKNNKSDWIYAPKVNGNAEDAAFKIVGAACASQCTWSELECSGFTFRAFLPRRDAIASKISNIGAFISVDARPVSAARGTFKQILKIFRETLKNAEPSFADIRDPFLFLKLSCPRGSYDANLEPAKDDLLFEDASVVIETARRLFATAYERHESSDLRPETADLPRQQLQQDLDDVASSTPAPADDGGQEPVSYTPSGAEVQKTSAHGAQSNNDLEHRQRAYRSKMYGCDEEDLETLNQRPPSERAEADLEELRGLKHDVTVSNPWITAKLNASVRQSTASEYVDDRAAVQAPENPVSSSSSPLKNVQQYDLGAEALPTPRASSPSPDDRFNPSDHVPDSRMARDGRMIGSRSLPQPESYSAQPSVNTAGRPAYDYDVPPQLLQSTPLAAIPIANAKSCRKPGQASAQTKINKPFVSPMLCDPSRENVWFDHLQEPRTKARRKGKPPSSNTNGLVVQGELGDLLDAPRALTPPLRNHDIRSFIARNQPDSADAMTERRSFGRADHDVLDLTEVDENNEHDRAQQQRAFIPASEVMDREQRTGLEDQYVKLASKRRKTSARHALTELSANAPRGESVGDAEPLADEEYHPDSRQLPPSRPKSSNKLGRRKSSRLPLERTPAGQGTHALSLTCNIPPRFMAEMAMKVDISSSLLDYSEAALPTATGMDAISTQLPLLAANLHGLLVSNDDDITSPMAASALLKEVKAAFARREQMSSGTVGDEEMLV